MSKQVDSTNLNVLNVDGSGISVEVDSNDIDHDLTSNFVATEHVDWTSTTEDFKTTGSFTLADGSESTGRVLQCDATGLATWVDGGSVSDLQTVPDYTALKALATGIEAVIMTDFKRGGVFYWDNADRSAEVLIDTREGIYVPPNTDVTGASGSWRRWQEDCASVVVDWFNTTGDGVTDDQPAFQAAIDWVKNNTVKNRGGIVEIGCFQYAIGSTIVIDEPGVIVQGKYSAQSRTVATAAEENSVLIGTSTTDAIIKITDGDVSLRDLNLIASVTRAAALPTRGSGTANCGILINREDRRVRMVTLRNVRIVEQPSDGIYIAGGTDGINIENVAVRNNKAHGIVVDKGFLIGDVQARPYNITISNSIFENCAGHGILVGDIQNIASGPLNVNIVNCTVDGCASDLTQCIEDAATFLDGNGCAIRNSYLFGNTGAYCLYAAGRGCDVSTTVFNESGKTADVYIKSAAFTCQNLSFFLCTAQQVLTNFAEIDSGNAHRNIRFENIAGGYTNVYSYAGAGGFDSINVFTSNDAGVVRRDNAGSFVLDTSPLTYIDGNQGAGKYLQSDASGLASWQTVPNSFTPAYGSLNSENNSSGSALTVTNTYVEVPFETNGTENLNTTPDAANNRIQVDTAGVYFISFNAAYNNSANQLEWRGHINGLGQGDLHTGSTSFSTSAYTNISFYGIKTLATNDLLTVRVRSNTTLPPNTTPICRDANLVIYRIA